MRKKLGFILLVFLVSISFITSCTDKYKDLDLSVYQYRDTKQLVKFVYDAAMIFEKEGTKNIEYFRSNRNLFNTKDHYLYIYDIEGKNIYHAGMKHLEGKDLWDITDKNGKKITELVLSALEDDNNPHSWVHYSWWEPGKFYPVPKTSCHFKIKTPEGKEFFVGGGMNYPHEEKEFIRIAVDAAANLINEKEEKAFEKIASPSSQYNYRDVRVFVFKADGNILISPVLDDSLSQIQLLECVDEIGHKPFAKALKQLRNKESVWEVFMAKNRFQRELIKKCLYIRKGYIMDEEIYVGAVTDLPQPPY